MPWLCFGLTYCVDSPLHIGFYQSGYIQHTRKYVPGRTMWGAATARITRVLCKSAQDKDYELVGKWIAKNLIFGYFYIGDEACLLPCYTQKGLYFVDFGNSSDKISESEFERRFICTFTQTSVRGKTQTAEDESLHEMEFIVHKMKDTTAEVVKQMMLTGHVFVNLDARSSEGIPDELALSIKNESDLTDLLNTLFIGGELAYGNGRISLLNEPVKTNSVFDWKFNGEGKYPKVQSSDTRYLRAHAARGNDCVIKGDIERLAFRSWSSEKSNSGIGAGRNVGEAGSCWVPGSVTMPKASFRIGKYGIWEKTNGV